MTGFEPVAREIGGKKFIVRPLKFSVGREGLRRLITIIVPSAGSLLGSGDSVLSAARAPKISSAIGDLLSQASARFDTDTLEWFEAAFGTTTKVEISEGVAVDLDKPGTREGVFGRDYLAYFEWLGMCLEMNYRPFFEGALSKIAALFPAKVKPEDAEKSA